MRGDNASQRSASPVPKFSPRPCGNLDEAQPSRLGSSNGSVEEPYCEKFPVAGPIEHETSGKSLDPQTFDRMRLTQLVDCWRQDMLDQIREMVAGVFASM